MDHEQIKIIAILILLVMIAKTFKLSMDGFNHLKYKNYPQYSKECVSQNKKESLREYINKDSVNVLSWFANVFIMIIAIDLMIHFWG